MTNCPLQTEADFDNAVAEIGVILTHRPEPGSARERRLDDLLGYIAEYHDDQPPAVQAANVDALQTLDAHLKTFGRQWRRQSRSGGAEHWSPLLGGDVNPAHHDS